MKEKFARWEILFAQYIKRDWKKIIIWILGVGLFSGGFVPAFEELAEELHKPVIKKFTRRQANVFQVDEIWGAHLVEMQEWSRVNKGYRYMLNIIDVFSTFAWSIPLKDKKGETVTEAFKSTVKQSNRLPKFFEGPSPNLALAVIK